MRIMAAMDEHKHPQQDMIESFETGAMPPPSSPAMVRPAPLPPAPPRICEVGPCRSYHRLEFMLDAQNPLDGSDGRIHLKVMHSCYTQVGVDTDITDVPVFACNRWDPFIPGEHAIADVRRDAALDTDEGEAFEAQLKAWEAEVERRKADNPIEGDAQAIDPLLARMHELCGSKDLPEHVPATDGTFGLGSEPACVPDCALCALTKAATDSLLLDSGDDHEGDEITDIEHTLGPIRPHATQRVIRTEGLRIRDGARICVGQVLMPERFAHLPDGTRLTIERGQFTEIAPEIK